MDDIPLGSLGGQIFKVFIRKIRQGLKPHRLTNVHADTAVIDNFPVPTNDVIA